MFRFIPRIYLDFASFWIGVLAASLFWFLYNRFRPQARKAWSWIGDQWLIIQSQLATRTTDHLRQKTLEFAQKQHLTAHLFSLDEIIHPPRLYAPPHQLTADGFLPDLDTVQQTIPYTPDSPEFAAEYQYPTISIEDAVSQGANLAIMGRPGSGKTVALAHFASRLARREMDPYKNLVPIFIDAVDLLPSLPTDDVVGAVTEALSANQTIRQAGPLDGPVKDLFHDNKAFLLIDSVDILPRQESRLLINFIKLINHTYPDIQLITTCSSYYYDGLLETDLFPVSIAAWGTKARSRFIKNWGRKYTRFHPGMGGSRNSPSRRKDASDRLLMNNWLFFDHAATNPLEVTLKAWALYAGDVIGRHAGHAIDACLRRISSNLPDPTLPNLQVIALEALKNTQPSFTRDDIHRWLQGPTQEAEGITRYSENPLGEVIALSLEHHVLTLGGDRRYRFTHPSIAGYLAARACTSMSYQPMADVLRNPHWDIAREAFRFSGAFLDLSPLFSAFPSSVDRHEPLQRSLLQLGSLLPFLPPKSKERDKLQKEITRTITTTPFLDTKFRLASTLIGSGDPDTSSIFRFLLGSQHWDVRLVAILGCGVLRDTQSEGAIMAQLSAHPRLARAACLSLVNIGTPAALEAVAEQMLTGEDTIRRAAAEALANHVIEGHPTLKDASERDKLTVRHASVYGLKRIHEPWSIDILDEMRIEEDEWVVRDAAQGAYESIQQPSPFIPSATLPFQKIPPIANFASEKEMEISSQQEVYELLPMLLQEGSIDQVISALHYIQMEGFGSVFPEIYHIMLSDNIEAQSAAANTLWHLSLTGMDIPPLQKYGLL